MMTMLIHKLVPRCEPPETLMKCMNVNKIALCNLLLLISGSKVKYPGPGLLQLIDVSTKESGIYSCDISNSCGSTSQSFKLTVQKG